ncbi:ABC transporter substrate-binding protein [Geoalkalibacter ferrihydriticus DSM 17813]|uniref:Thiamine pyrimidine synthase n=1 Tax=Geoalkalibacter ferrihydriticus DSM 17813 TaxID=1121915 RepID=A0A0C2EEZ9_9BACT|nr:ABC transporter substrate-binding protein [Geoalkalibacter ferrihydriticus DSM 17813]
MLLLLLLGAGTHPAAVAATGLKKASLMPLWSPQAQFAGYYVALEKGIYAKHGIDLKILEGGPGHSSAEALQDGTADFAVLWLSTALQQNDSGKTLVNLAQIVQESSMILVARKSSGITTPAAMQGKKVGLWGGDLALPAEAFFTKNQLQVNRIPQSYTVNLFLRGGVDVASVMWYNEYHTILMSGVNPEELDLFFLKDYGIAFPEDGLYTLKETYRQDPALAAAFAQASLEGWQYAFDHPEEAVDIVLRYMREAKVPANRTHQTWMLERMRDLIVPQNNDQETGQLSSVDYAAVTDTLRTMGHIMTTTAYDDFIGNFDVEN